MNSPPADRAASTGGQVPARRAAPRVCIVTDRRLAGIGESLTARVARALEGAAAPNQSRGAADARDVIVQLREKDLGGRELLELAGALRRLTEAAGARLFVNDRVDVALAAGADGVHLGGGGLPPETVRTIAPELAISVATHSAVEVARAAATPGVDFAILGPIFDTPSKARFGLPPLGLEVLTEGCRLGLPVVAIGGVEGARAAACLAAGASGVACIRGVLSAPDPGAALGGLLALWPSGNGKR